MGRTDKKNKVERELEKAISSVGAGQTARNESVDFSSDSRPETCLEVDFPILPINHIATIEGKGSGALKPIYQTTKWWARRRSTVFRQLLIAAATKCPDDPAEAAKASWVSYYKNHQKNKSFRNLKVADVFMGGGTTLIEGARLGMQMYGTDLNPVAWFVVKNELANVDPDKLKSLLEDVEKDVRPKIMPFYKCKCPRGHRGKWICKATKKEMPSEFDASTLDSKERSKYHYEGPEIIYQFWAKHGPCQMTGCGHRTPIISNPVVATKSFTVKAWEVKCKACFKQFDIEEKSARLAPGVPVVVTPEEKPFANLSRNLVVICPHCNSSDKHPALSGKGFKKRIELSILLHPNWIAGLSDHDPNGTPFGGSITDDCESSVRWTKQRGTELQLLEVRGKLPKTITCPVTGNEIRTGKDGGTIPSRSKFACGACGAVQDVLESIKSSGRAGAFASYAIQGYCPICSQNKEVFGGRFYDVVDEEPFSSALIEWKNRKDDDLTEYWPRTEVPYGFMTGMANGDIRLGHGFTHWWTMFNPRQLLVHTQLLKSILSVGGDEYSWDEREALLGSFQQYLRNQNMFCFWNIQRALEPMFSNNNFHPKSTVVENSVFTGLGRGDFLSSSLKLLEAIEWSKTPWEIAADNGSSHSIKVPTGDPLTSVPKPKVYCSSATDLSNFSAESMDLVVTDPPFGGLLHYSELSDFFYVWLRIALAERYPNEFGSELTPKSLEAVANRARHGAESDAFYQRLLTECWREARRILKPSGILAFTFHHSEDEPWISVLESLFDAGYYLAATYPIRSDETKGQGEFGSKKIEYDIIHVCRKQVTDSEPISWPKMRREVLRDIRRLQELLAHHSKEGLPEADLQVIRRGKALEYFSRHYGKVYKDENTPISVKEALVGINQLLDEEAGGVKDPPPHAAEPLTRMFLRLFDNREIIKRDQIQKFLRGTGASPSDFVNCGWCYEKGKVFYLTAPVDIAREWQGKHRKGMNSDYDQAVFLIGACFEGSGISINDTLNNTNFKPHPALSAILTWMKTRGATNEIRNAASRAWTIHRSWEAKHQTPKSQQIQMFFAEEGA